jgi:hypothetical protein
MITLTNPFKILDVLGGITMVDYETVVVTSLNVNTVSDGATGSCELRSSANNRPTLRGNLRILTNVDPSIIVEFPDLGFFKKVVLSSGQASTVSNVFKTLKADVESGLVTLGLVDGVQG